MNIKNYFNNIIIIYNNNIIIVYLLISEIDEIMKNNSIVPWYAIIEPFKIGKTKTNSPPTKYIQPIQKPKPIPGTKSAIIINTRESKLIPNTTK